MDSRNVLMLIGLVLIVMLGLSAVFTVDERELAIKFRLGKIVRADYEPGLHFKVPLINNVRKFDKRILTLDARPANYLTKEKKNVIVDFFVKWRIHDVVTYYKAMSGEERKAMERIYATINDGLRSEFGKRSIQEVISGERSEIMNTMTNEANRQLGKFGVEVVDVRVKRIDFSDDISDSVYRRMEAERLRVAKDFRSRGAEEAEKIRARADKERTVLLADAYKQAQTIRGEGDAKAAEIYAKAYKQDPEFFAFYRSLQSYRKSLGGESDTLVLEPDSEFFRYFGSQKAGRK